MASLITLKGIDQAISNLTYKNKNALKYRLITTIRQYYKDENSFETIQGIDAEELAQALWNVRDDPTATESRRKNLRRIRYALNADLRGLYKEGKNPEGITIGPANIFVMSDEAKDRTLKALLADRDGLMGADLAELTRDYQGQEGVSPKGTGLLGEVGAPEELMNEEEIAHAIEELDEDFVLESFEAPEGGAELGEPTVEEDLGELEEPHEMHATTEPPEGQLRGTPEDAEAGALTEEVEEEEHLGEITFDPEETQYLSVPEEEEALQKPDQAKPGEGKASLGNDTEGFEETDLISTVDSEQEVSPEGAQGVEETITSGPKDISMLQQLAAAKEESGQLEAALGLYQKILDISPGDEKAEEACLRLSLKLMDKGS
jgi:tetratricopeptide (TPR) repeat protein